MADDLANGWGCTLVLGARSARQPVEGNCFKRLEEEVIKSTKGEFYLAKVAACGSDANAFATLEATVGNTSSLCIAAGSYVAGDCSVLQNWSSSSFEIQSGLAMICLPNNVHSEFSRQHTVALPYRIPCDYCNNHGVDDYEDHCFDALHARLLASRLFNRPFRSLLLEIILAGNGATMSDRAYCKLAKLLEHHGMTCVVDECLTGARCGPSILLTQSLPELFRKRATHITIAKWPGIGMVLVNKEIRTQMIASNSADSRRGQSTEVSCEEATKLWQEAERCLSDNNMITQRRKAVLKAVKLTERETWGTGLLMYGPKRRDDSAQALKNRYLPLLSTTKVDTIKFKRRDDYRKECVCQTIRTQVLTWVDHYPVAIREEEKGLSGQVGWLLCRELSKPSWRDQFFRAEDLTQAFGSTEIEDSDVKEALKLAVREGFIRPWQNSKKRTRGFRVESVFHVNYEEVIEDGN